MAEDSVSAKLSSTGTIVETPGSVLSSVRTTLMTDFLFPVARPPSFEVRLRLVLGDLKLPTSFSLTCPGLAGFCCIWFGSVPPGSKLPEASTPAPPQILPFSSSSSSSSCSSLRQMCLRICRLLLNERWQSLHSSPNMPSLLLTSRGRVRMQSAVNTVCVEYLQKSLTKTSLLEKNKTYGLNAYTTIKKLLRKVRLPTRQKPVAQNPLYCKTGYKL